MKGKYGYITALVLFILGFICTLFLGGGKQFALASISFIGCAFFTIGSTCTVAESK